MSKARLQVRRIAGVAGFTGKVDGGGVKDGTGKVPLGCIPPQPLFELGKVFGFGMRKYARNNWLRGIAWTDSYDALQRHLNYWYSGEDLDPESGLSHLAHAMWHCCVLLYWTLRADLYAKFDNRPFKTRHKKVA